MNGPTLVKKPEKLRASSPVPTDNIPPPRRLAPMRSPAPRPPRPDTTARDGQDFPAGNTYYRHLDNREFDGRALDPSK